MCSARRCPRRCCCPTGPAAAAGDHVVGVAVLGVLRALSRSRPLLLALDDVQWLDRSSRMVLSFALRRLVDEPIRLIASCRSGAPSEDEAADLGVPGERMNVGPVSIGVLQRIIQSQLDQSFSRPTLTRLHQATGGNPMMCLEMARALQLRGREPEVGEPLPVPADFRALVTERLKGVSEQARQLLLDHRGPCSPDRSTRSRRRWAIRPRRHAALAEAVEAGLLEFDGERIHFRHPLIASIPYADLAPTDRRRLHERLAASVTDPEEHARHAALGSLQKSALVADALDIAARRARDRGSIDGAAELAELAVRRTPVDDPDALLRRTVDAAEYRFRLGDTVRARTVLTAGLDAAAPGPLRVRGLLLGGDDRVLGVRRRDRRRLVRAGDD